MEKIVSSFRRLTLSPDGVFYFEMAAGKGVPYPYNLRWLLPKLLRQNNLAWNIANIVGLMTLVLAIAYYSRSFWAVPLTLLGPAVWFWMKRPVLADVWGLALAVIAAIFAPFHPVTAILCAFLAGFVNEKAPLFAAIFAWNPILLFGLTAPALSYFFAPVGPVPETLHPETRRQMSYILDHPFISAYEFHQGTAFKASKWLWPWGGLLLGAFVAPTPVYVALVTSYAMCIAATDSQRLYAWAMPMLVAAVCTMPWQFCAVAVAISWFVQPHIREYV